MFVCDYNLFLTWRASFLEDNNCFLVYIWAKIQVFNVFGWKTRINMFSFIINKNYASTMKRTLYLSSLDMYDYVLVFTNKCCIKVASLELTTGWQKIV